MCLLVLAIGMHPQFDLVVAGNRDERHSRPTAALDAWQERPGMLAGRDLEAGGTWLGIHRTGRFAAVTNFREGVRSPASAPSRGALVADFLSGTRAPREYLQDLAQRAADFAGFNLLVADRRSVWYASNRAAEFARPLEPGFYGLSNHLLDTPWPKLLRSRERLRDWVDRGAHDTGPLFDLLADREPAQWGPAEPTAELARAASAAFIVHDVYGTRASTVLTRSGAVGQAARMQIAERRFAAGGRAAGESALPLDLVAEEPAGAREL